MPVAGAGRNGSRDIRTVDPATRRHICVDVPSDGAFCPTRGAVRFAGLPSLRYLRPRPMPRELRLLWVTPNLPRRGVSAARERFWALLARLAARHRVTLLAFVDPEDADAPNDVLPPGLAAVHRVAKTPYAPDDPFAILPQTVAGGFSNPALRDAIAARLAAEPFDLVQYEYTEMGNLMPPSPVPTILTVHQIAFAQEAPLWHALGRPARFGAVLLHRYLRELDFELRAVASADHVIAMSPEDADRLRRFRPGLAVSVSPVGVDCSEFRPSPVRGTPTTDLLFVGNFGHPPNADAARFLVRDVLPRMARSVTLRIVGRDAERVVGALAGQHGRVEVLGSVPDLRPHLANARVVVAPVRFGTGMRGKVLEALAMARPVVTTRIGAEGLGAESWKHLAIADGAADVAGAAQRLLDDPALAVRLGNAGRQLVCTQFDWDVVAAGHDAIYERVLASNPRGARPAPPPSPRSRLLRGWAAIGAGFGLLAARGVAWHLRRLRAA
jgi:glycosyltransferase involved in cell wall biosynthesis